MISLIKAQTKFNLLQKKPLSAAIFKWNMSGKSESNVSR